MLSKELLIRFKPHYFLLFFIGCFVSGQQYFSKQLTTKDGLPDNQVYAVLKDKEGKLWIGTSNGLVVKGAKYNTIYKKKHGLPHNACWQIIEDKIGQIWIGTFGGGLALYKNGRFKIFDNKNGLASNKIRKLFLFNDDLYIGTANGISKINIKSKKIKTFNIRDKRTIRKNEKKDVEVMGINQVNGKIIFNTHSHGFYTIKGLEAKPLNKNLNTTFCLFKDKDDLYFSKNGFANKGNAVFKINANDLVSSKREPKAIGQINSIFWDMVKIGKDSIIGAAHGVEYNTGGLYLIQKEIKKLNDIFGIKSNNIWDLYYDNKEKILYVGTMGEGLYIIHLQKNNLKQKEGEFLDYQSNEFFNSVILQKEKLNISIPNNNHIFSKKELYKLITKRAKELSNEAKKLSDAHESNFPYNGFILKSFRLNKNTISILTNYGIIELAFSKNFVNKNVHIISAEAYAFVDKKSILFSFPYSALIYIPDKQKPNFYKKYETNDLKYYPRDITKLFFTKNHKYILNRDGNLYLLLGKDLSKLNFKLVSRKKEIQHELTLNDSSIALGDKEGNIYLFNENKKNFSISLKKIIPESEIHGNTLLGLLHYKKHLILITEKGINLYDLKTKENIIIDNEMGVDYENVLSSSIYQNQLKLSTDNGIYNINIDQWIKTNKTLPLNLYISKLYVNEQLTDLKKTELKSTENRVTIDFDTGYHPFPNKISYRYKLIGLENNHWSKWNPEGKIVFPFLPSGNYHLHLQIRDASTGKICAFKLISFSIATPLWKNTYFLFLLGGIISLMLYYYIKYRIKKVKRREQEIAFYEKRIVETKMEALQSQMNPHFIFNSLNVIQHHIIDNDAENSLSYVNNFSKLMRKTLEHSSKTFISIQEELEFIQMYIETQNIRFNHKVQFRYSISKELELDNKIIPPMMIQPLIENCFIHAFSEESKNPQVHLKIEQNKNALEISIADNGRGIKCKTLNQHSKALQLLKERLTLLNKENALIIRQLEIGTEIKLFLYK